MGGALHGEPPGNTLPRPTLTKTGPSSATLDPRPTDTVR